MNLKEMMLPAPRGGGFAMEGYWVWCGSVIQGEDGRYHMFASRWPKTQPMHPGWLLQSEIVRAVSDTPCGPYEFQEVVLPARGPQYWDGRATHNPRILKTETGYVLYYTGITHPFADITEEDHLVHEDPRVIVARASKRIGIATSKSIFGPWKRREEPIMPVRAAYFDNLLTSNAAPCLNEDGSVVMIYKARAYKNPPYVGQLHGNMTIGIAWADSPEGPYRRGDGRVFADDVEIEDPFIWKTENGYELIAKDMHGNICGEQFGGMYAHSADGQTWEIHRGELAYSRRVLWDDGKEELMGNMERPHILFENGKPTHMFFATSDGTESFMDATKTWNMVIPLKQ